MPVVYIDTCRCVAGDSHVEDGWKTETVVRPGQFSTHCIAYWEGQEFSQPLVHLIDREGDSVGPIRRREAAGCYWLGRVKDNPKVEQESRDQ